MLDSDQPVFHKLERMVVRSGDIGSVRVLQALTTAQIGGTERMVVRLVEGLRGRSVTTMVTVLEDPGPISEELGALSVHAHHLRLGTAGYLRAWTSFRRLLETEHFDVIHLYGMRMSWIGRTAARGRRRPVVIHGIRGLNVTESEEAGSTKVKLSLLLERLGTRMIDVYAANSHAAVDFMVAAGINRDRFVVIPNGIEVPPERARVSSATPLTIVCVANFRARKRQEDVARAVQLLAERGLSCRCIFVGDGPTRASIESRAKRHGLAGKLMFAGSLARADVAALLQECDIAVLASTWEGLPGSLMEAMAAGLPVVATDVPGTRELVSDGETGFLVPVKSPSALAERLATLVTSSALRLRMGRAARTRMEKNYSVAQMVEAYERLYCALAAQRRERI